MYFTSSISTITPAMVSVAMSRSDSRDSTTSTSSFIADNHHFTPAPMTVSYSTSPISYLARTNSNMSSSTSSSSRRASSSTSRRESSSQWMPSPFRSCQTPHESSSYLSDDDLLYIAPPTSVVIPELPIESIPQVQKRRELTTEEQIAMMRETQSKEQEHELASLQQQRRQAAVAAQKAVRFADQKPRRPSAMRRRTTVKKGLSQMSQ